MRTGQRGQARAGKYHAKVLDGDLEIHAINGVARIVQDDLEATYSVCFEERGRASCPYKP